jgi:hypothetical protein
LKRTANDIDTKVVLLAALVLYLYETDYMQGFLKKSEKKLTFRYKYDVVSLNNSRFGDYVVRIYPIELSLK